jgi:uncharacterized protein YneF (UPF0154 family)
MTVVLAIWGALGPLVGVLVGAWLARSWQWKQWVLENKKSEYRELIGVLSKSYHNLVKNLPETTTAVLGPEEQRALGDDWVAGLQVIEDRVFIDKEIRAAKIREQWWDMGDWDLKKTTEKWPPLHETLVRMAHKELGIR